MLYIEIYFLLDS